MENYPKSGISFELHEPYSWRLNSGIFSIKKYEIRKILL